MFFCGYLFQVHVIYLFFHNSKDELKIIAVYGLYSVCLSLLGMISKFLCYFFNVLLISLFLNWRDEQVGI